MRVENGGQEGGEFGGGFGLEALQRVHLRLQPVQLATYRSGCNS
jgi:hypothetical protein